MDKIKHAKHNESASRFLSQKPDYADWVVITAFYSAIHFVEHKIFPYTVGDSTFQTLEQYYISVKHLHPTRNKHWWRQQLVANACGEISTAYNWLFNTCNNVRYTNYELPKPRETSTQAATYLKKIKDHCSAK
jgi:hypothetical protein